MNLYVARLKEKETVNIGLCKCYDYLRKNIFVCKFLSDNDFLEIFAKPKSFEKSQDCKYEFHLSMQQQGTEFWDSYWISDKKGILEENRLILEDGMEIDRSLDLGELVQCHLFREMARRKEVPEEIINNIP